MNLDIRIPLGLMFSVLGLILAVYGVFSNPAIYARSLGHNVNLIWGGFLLLFGAAMLALARRSASQRR
jgi:hypothetical protein